MDRRENPRTWPEGTTFDERKMTVTLLVEDEDGEEHKLTVPFKWVVCDVCEGKGTHVNPSIDADHGITREEFDEDPGFKEDYFNGVYDVTCCQCHGKRVVPEPVDELAALNEHRQAEAEYRMECEMERRMGA